MKFWNYYGTAAMLICCLYLQAQSNQNITNTGEWHESSHNSNSSICGLYPGGRIAMASDGNTADADDHGASAMAIAMLHYAGLLDKLVYVGHSSLYKSQCKNSFGNWCHLMDTSTVGTLLKLGGDTNIVHSYHQDYQDNGQLDQSITAFKDVINASTVSDPLWIYCAGPMDVVYRAIDAADPGKRKFVKCISHSNWNENSTYGGLQHTWSDMKSSFTNDGVEFYEIADQNKSNGQLDFRDESSPAGSNWGWLTAQGSPPFWTWLRSRNLDSWFAQNNKAGEFDISDAGMMYWLISGGPINGCENCGTLELEQLFLNPCNTVELEKTHPLESTMVQVYPNPARTILHLKHHAADRVSVNIYSINARPMDHIELEPGALTTLDLCKYPKGIYLLQMRSSGQVETLRIIIE